MVCSAMELMHEGMGFYCIRALQDGAKGLASFA